MATFSPYGGVRVDSMADVERHRAEKLIHAELQRAIALHYKIPLRQAERDVTITGYEAEHDAFQLNGQHRFGAWAHDIADIDGNRSIMVNKYRSMEWTTSATSYKIDYGNGWSNSYTTSAITSNAWSQWVGVDPYETMPIMRSNGTRVTFTINSSDLYKYVSEAETIPPPAKEWPKELARAATEMMRQIKVWVDAVEKIEADERAEALLLSLLDETQRNDWKRSRAFTVCARSGKRYKLSDGWAGNVMQINSHGGRVRRFCIHPGVRVPHCDNLISQLLLLTTDEEKFLATANAS